jgi:hypothetical protein
LLSKIAEGLLSSAKSFRSCNNGSPRGRVALRDLAFLIDKIATRTSSLKKFLLDAMNAQYCPLSAAHVTFKD